MARKYGLYVNGQYIHTLKWHPVFKATQASDLLGEVAFYDGQVDDPEIREAALEGLHQTFLQVRHEEFFPFEERLAFLARLATRLEDQRENFAQLIMNEIGKPIALARTEVDRACETLRWTIEEAREFFGATPLPTEKRKAWENFEGEVRREPRGVLLAMSPFNFPLNLVMHKLAPAIASGCPVLLKPSSKAALSALCLVDYCHAEGLPPGMLNFFSCENADVPGLIADPRIAHISFTGSVPVGWSLKKQTTKPFTLELGGAAPVFVAATANLERAAESLAKSAIAYAGQVCISTQSIHVEASVFESFEKIFRRVFGELSWGLPSLDEVICGPVIDTDAQARLMNLRKRLLAVGAKAHDNTTDPLSAAAIEAKLVRPTYFTDVPPKDTFFSEECFGPYVALRATSSAEEFIDFANALPSRLQTSVWCEPKGSSLQKLVRDLDYGGVIVNESPSLRFDAMPYGGRGASGCGREGPRYALAEFTDYKSVLIRKNES